MSKLGMGAAVIYASVCLASPSQAQTAQDLVGAWRVVSIASPTPGRDAAALGENPNGTIMFGSDGRFALIFVRSDLPKLASNSRASGTPEENRAIVQGSIAFYGTYAVEDAGRTLVMRIENGTFPNWAGAEQRRPMTLNGNEFTYTTSGSGDNAARVTLRRASY
jgi:hypothetical protein